MLSTAGRCSGMTLGWRSAGLGWRCCTLQSANWEVLRTLRAEIVGTVTLPVRFPCAPAPEYGDRREKNGRYRGRCSRGQNRQTRPRLRTHTQRSEPCRDGGVGWEGGADLASAGSMRPRPPQHVTSARAWLATFTCQPSKRHVTTKVSQKLEMPAKRTRNKGNGAFSGKVVTASNSTSHPFVWRGSDPVAAPPTAHPAPAESAQHGDLGQIIAQVHDAVARLLAGGLLD